MFHGLNLLLLSTAWAACLAYASKLKSRVNFASSDLSPHQADAFLRLNADTFSSLNGSFSPFNIPDVSGKLSEYLCFIPTLSRNQSESSSKLVNDQISNEPELVSRALAIIESAFSRENCVFLYGVGGSYWTYAFCFMDKIIQFHVDMPHLIQNGEHKAVIPNHVYVLGRFRGAPHNSFSIGNDAKNLKNSLSPRDFNIYDELSDEAAPSPGSTKSQRFLQHTISNGEMCRLIDKPRTIDIKYSCDPQNMQAPTILDVQEILTCRYQISITVPQLCQLQEFVPRYFQDEVKTINCRKISAKQMESFPQIDVESVDDFMNLDPPLKSDFPLGQELHINLNEFSTFPLGFGLYRVFETNSQNNTDDWENRLRLVLNKPCNSTRELAAQIKQTMTWTLHSLIPSPRFVSQNTVEALSWNDSFIMWFEVYDYFGDFQSLVRVERNGGNSLGEIDVVAVDPLTMKDHDGNLVALGDFKAMGGMWNFEYFESHEDRLKALLSAKPSHATQDKPPASDVTAEHLLESIASKLGYESTDKVLDTLEGILGSLQEFDFDLVGIEPGRIDNEDIAAHQIIESAKHGYQSSTEKLSGTESTQKLHDEVTSHTNTERDADYIHDSSLRLAPTFEIQEHNEAQSNKGDTASQVHHTSTTTTTLPHDEL